MAVRYSRHTAAEWAALIDRQQRSGLSQAEFCKRNDLALSTFTYWKRRLAGGTASKLRQPKHAAAPGIPLFTALTGADDAADAAPDRVSSGSNWEVDLDLGNGVRLSIRRVA